MSSSCYPGDEAISDPNFGWPHRKGGGPIRMGSVVLQPFAVHDRPQDLFQWDFLKDLWPAVQKNDKTLVWKVVFEGCTKDTNGFTPDIPIELVDGFVLKLIIIHLFNYLCSQPVFLFFCITGQRSSQHHV